MQLNSARACPRMVQFFARLQCKIGELWGTAMINMDKPSLCHQCWGQVIDRSSMFIISLPGLPSLFTKIDGLPSGKLT